MLLSLSKNYIKLEVLSNILRSFSKFVCRSQYSSSAKMINLLKLNQLLRLNVLAYFLLNELMWIDYC